MTRSNTLRLITMTLLLALTSFGAFACGGMNDDVDNTAAATRTTTVVIGGMKYTPQEITVARGGTVTWSNTANQQHIVSVKDSSGKEVGRKALNQGEEFTHTFAEPGTYSFMDPGHSSFAALKGTVTVK